MNRKLVIQLVVVIFSLSRCNIPKEKSNDESILFPSELVDFIPISQDPVFEGTGADTWDKKIRERGYILHEGNIYKMWYTGFDGSEDPVMHLGYATSVDGIKWDRYPGNPIFADYWTEDVHVVKYEGSYFMVAEGVNDIAHMLTSVDGIHWQNLGDLDIRKVNGDKIDPGPYGTPTLWVEGNNWYLFYERGDLGIWLAVSTDQNVWTNVQDNPVMEMGPGKYDVYGLAINQIIKYKGKYYAYYHGTPDKDWERWNSNVAVSEDLVHWIKYDKNPIIDTDTYSGNNSSPIVVHDGEKYRLYTMHQNVRVYNPKKAIERISNE